jgi:hypothetical protein
MVKAGVSNFISASDILSASKNKTGGSCPVNFERFEKISKLNGHNYMHKVAKMLLDMDKNQAKKVFPTVVFDEMVFKVMRYQIS